MSKTFQTGDNSTNTRRLAKNTIVLYVRMVIVMLIALYTSRVVLKALGVEDYGLYNVIGGVVGLFAFLRSSMEKATQRFLNFEMARTDGNTNKVFCVNLAIHIGIVIIILLLTETIGLWFLNSYIEIPLGREVAANWVYQSVIVSLCLTVLSVPYSACIIAHEEMSFYAVVTIIDALLKLGIAFLIMYDDGDRLILYGVLIACISLINLVLYFLYCRFKYSETKFHIVIEKTPYRDVFSFVSWTMLGQSATLAYNQANNILLNMYFGVVANAAMGIANQVGAAVTNLSSNFQTAFNPQITKSYAAGDFSYLSFLIFITSKLSFYLMFIISFPIMLNMDEILSIWLAEVPNYSSIFSILIIIDCILSAISTPLNFCVMATGRIKWLQITTSAAFLVGFIIADVLFVIGFPPATALAVKVGVMAIVVGLRLYFTRREIESVGFISYFRGALLPIIKVGVLCVIMGVLLMNFAHSAMLRIVLTIVLVLISMVIIYLIGLTSIEKQAIKNLIKK